MACLLLPFADLAATGPDSGAALLQDLRRFRELGSVLYVAAHPDDENTQLITYFSRGRGYRTAYLSLTRGDGGQNVLGPEFGEELGVIRTQELLAARGVDGGQQFFTRAIDFGFSKDYREALRIWDRQQVLADVVRVIRTFQPDVIITRFSPQPGGTHGHHTASAVLAIEAFQAAGDPKAFPDQLDYLKPWQAKRILLNAPNFGRTAEPSPEADVLHLNADGEDPVTGESFSQLAARSRSMHKTQGFGNFTGFGGRGRRGESFSLLGGAPATNDIMDGVETTWARVPGGAELDRMTEIVITNFKPDDPAASVPALLGLRKRVQALPQDRLVLEKSRELDHILQGCLGLSVRTAIPDAEVVAGEKLALQHTALVRSDVPVRWLAVRYPTTQGELKLDVALRKDVPASSQSSPVLPANTPITQPYWLRQDHSAGMFQVADPKLIGQPENPPAFPLENVFEVGGQTLVVPDEPREPETGQGDASRARRLEVIAPVSLRFLSEVKLFAPGTERDVEVELTTHRQHEGGIVRLEAPATWHVSPAEQPFRLEKPGEQARFSFQVTAPTKDDSANAISAQVKIGTSTFDNERVEIRYDHIPMQLLQPAARLKAVSLELKTRGRHVGYLPGAGDSVAECLAQMGYEVTQLDGADLTTEKLRGFDSVVVGIRAFNVRKDLSEHLPALFDYVQHGGNVVVQYNRPGPKELAPYEIEISNDRVTDENAPMTFLAPDHPAFKTPNPITSADFEGWVQERGLYFPDQWDEHFTPLLACNDPGESPKKGALLVARYGEGYFVYTGLSWFRQLPAGVPGAYRLFANLVSLGK